MNGLIFNILRRAQVSVLLVAVVILAVVSPVVAADPALHDGLIAYWPFDDGAGSTATEAISANNATLQAGDAAPAWATGKFDGALSFDGTDDAAYVSGVINPGTSAVTVSTWVNLDLLPSEMTSFGAIFDSTTDNYILYMDHNADELRFKVISADGQAKLGISSADLSTGQWLHVAGVYNGSDARIYLNGELKGTAGFGVLGGAVIDGQLAGFGMEPTDPPRYPYAGMTDDVGVWNRALDSAEISYLYNNGIGTAIGAGNPTIPPDPTPDPVLQYNFENNLDNTGTAGAAKNGTLVGTTGTMSYIDGPVSSLGNAMNLANPTQEPQLTTGVHMEVDYVMPDDGTITFWAKCNSFYNYVAFLDNSLSGSQWEMWSNGGGVGGFRIDDNYSRINFDIGTDGDWDNYAMSWHKNDNDTVDMGLYLNGELVEIRTGPWIDSGTTFAIGGGINAANPAGDAAFDDFRLYDVVLTAEQIASLLPVPGPGDANNDGWVDEEDAKVLATNWLASGKEWADGDFNEDGLVNHIDVTIMAANWNPQPLASVPEPGSIVLLLGACLSIMSLRRRKVR